MTHDAGTYTICISISTIIHEIVKLSYLNESHGKNCYFFPFFILIKILNIPLSAADSWLFNRTENFVSENHKIPNRTYIQLII